MPISAMDNTLQLLSSEPDYHHLGALVLREAE